MQEFRHRYESVIVNLSHDAYLADAGIEDTPSWLQAEFVTVRFGKNTGSYRKLLPTIAMEDIGDEDLIITIDDDVLYSEEWLSGLITAATEYPRAIVCTVARKIKKNALGHVMGYRNWPIISLKNQSQDFLPIGCGGVVYRKALLDIAWLNDPSSRKIAPTNDDLWFKHAHGPACESVLVVPSLASTNIGLKHQMGLDQLNLQRGPSRGLSRYFHHLVNEVRNYLGISVSRNDRAWKAIARHRRSVT